MTAFALQPAVVARAVPREHLQAYTELMAAAFDHGAKTACSKPPLSDEASAAEKVPLILPRLLLTHTPEVTRLQAAARAGGHGSGAAWRAARRALASAVGERMAKIMRGDFRSLLADSAEAGRKQATQKANSSGDWW